MKRIQSEGAISSATLDRILLGIPSGPHALLGSKLRSTAATSEIVRSISESLLQEDSIEVESVEGGSTIFARNYETAAVISYNLKGIAPPRSPSSMLDRQKPDVWLRGANIETGGGRECGKNVSVNGILQPNACEN